MEKTNSYTTSTKTIANNTAVNSGATEKDIRKCASAPSSENKTNKGNHANTREEVPKKPLENELELQRRITEHEAMARAIERERAKEREREREQQHRERERYSNAPASKSLIEEIFETDFGLFLLIGLGILVFVSFQSIPETLRDSWNIFYSLSDGSKLINLNFSCTLLPAFLMTAIDVYCLSENKLTFGCKTLGFGQHLISQVLLGITVFVINFAVTCVIGILDGLTVAEGVLCFVILGIYYILPYSVYMLPVAFVFAIFAAFGSDD